jgi:GNAT superfamily N-acetyltransferase
MIIRQAKQEDREVLEEMFRTEILDDPQMAMQFAVDTLASGVTLLALEEHVLCGTLSWTRRWGYEDGVVELTALGVVEQYRRKGVASALLNRLIDDARDMFEEEKEQLRVIIIFMERGNEVAREFYAKHGFSETATIPSLYPHDDGVLWIRHFN